MKTLLSSLSQELALPFINQAIEYVSTKELKIETKIINFWNSVGDMLNKKFKGKLGRSSNQIKKVSTFTKKSDKTDEIVEEKRMANQNKTKTPFKDTSNHVSCQIVKSAIFEAQRLNMIYLNDAPKYNYIYNYAAPSIAGNQVMPNYISSNSNALHPNCLRFSTYSPILTMPVYNSYKPYPNMRTAGNCYYVPIHQN